MAEKAETNGETTSRTLEESVPSSLLPSKCKTDAESPEGEQGERETKQQKTEIASDPIPQPREVAIGEDDQNEEAADPNNGNDVLTAVDKGKGIPVEEEEDDLDDSSGGDSDDAVGRKEEDDSDFVDDPLAEIDLDNILPSRTRRRDLPSPGALTTANKPR